MSVYIEYVIIDNLIIDYLLLMLAYRLANVKTNFYRLIFSSAVGTCFAVLMPLISIDKTYLTIVKILVGFLLVLLGGKFLTIKKYLFSVLYFFIFTFMMGGAIIGLFYLADIDFEKFYSFNYDSFIPVGITVLLVYIFSELLKKLILKIFKEKAINPFIRKCVIVLKNKRITATGFYDSGNRLFDYKSGVPIIIGSNSLFNKIDNLGIFTKQKGEISIKTVSGEGKIKFYEVDKLLIYNGNILNIYNNVLIARSNEEFDDDIRYDLLLSTSFLEGG